MDQTRHAGATLLDSPTLVVKQKLKLIELKNEYEVYGPDGTVLGRAAGAPVAAGAVHADLQRPGRRASDPPGGATRPTASCSTCSSRGSAGPWTSPVPMARRSARSASSSAWAGPGSA